MSDKKFCVDCKHVYVKSVFLPPPYFMCTNPKYVGINRVTGRPKLEHCDTMRMVDCGPEANGFEPKPLSRFLRMLGK